MSGETLVRALDGVLFDIHPGEVVGILGPSGSGKSSLLVIANLLKPPTSGEIYIRDRLVSEPGAALDRLRDFRRNNIGFVFQKANLIPFLTAVENVALEIDDVQARAERDYAAQLLGSVDLAHRVGNLPMRLSGGEQQRVAVARALANDPALTAAVWNGCGLRDPTFGALTTRDLWWRAGGSSNASFCYLLGEA